MTKTQGLGEKREDGDAGQGHEGGTEDVEEETGGTDEARLENCKSTWNSRQVPGSG
jgi:hypothetical protein